MSHIPPMTSSSLSNLNFNHSIVNVVGGNQTTVTNVYPETQVSHPRSFNDAPVGRLSAYFTGREEDLDRVEQILNRTQYGIPNCCIIHGMPGVGKSQLSLCYAAKSFDGGLYTYIFWTSATSVDKLTQGFSKVLDLVGHPDRHVQDQSIKLTTARLWLEDCSAHWLFIIDNVDKVTLDFLSLHFPRINAQGNVLFTTRTVDVANALANMTRIPHSTLKLPTLSLHDSICLLLNDAGIRSQIITPVQLNYAEQLVESVGRLPLAVVQAASFIKQTDTTLDNMLQLYKSESKIEAIQWESDLSFYEERSVASTFSRQFEKLNEESSDVGNLLKVLSFLDLETIPVGMIVDGANEWLRFQNERSRSNNTLSHVYSQFHSLAILITSPIKFQTVLQKLQSLSLVERRSDSGIASLWMHDLIGFMIQDTTKKEESYRGWLESSVSLVCDAFGLIEDVGLPESWGECEKVISHLRSLNTKWGGVHGMNLELNQANVKIARYMDCRGRYDEAVTLLQRALSTYETHLGQDHPDTLRSMDSLGCMYWRQGRYDDAEVMHQRALAGREKHLGADHPDTLTSMHDLALVCDSQGRYDEAEALFQRVLTGYEKHFGADHPQTLTSLDNLALVYQSQGRYDEAETLFQRALAGSEKHLGADHPDTLTSVNNLALVYQSQGRYDDTEALFQRALAGSEKHLGANHPDTLASVNNLALVYRLQGRYNEAEMLFQRALAGYEKQLGSDHPDTLTSVNNLAIVYRSQGRYGEAATLFQRSLAGSERHLGANHPDTLTSVNNLAIVYQSQGRYDEAEALSQRASAGREKCLGADHPRMHNSMRALASIYESQGRHQEAEALYTRVSLAEGK